MTGQPLGGNWESTGVWALSLLIFSYGYNRLVSWAEKKGYLEGFTWLSVVVGVAITVLATGPVIGWMDCLWVMIAFCFSGFFMSIGAIGRYVTNRERHTEILRSEAHDAAEKVA